MAIKERNDSPHKPIGEGFFLCCLFFHTALYCGCPSWGLLFGTLAVALLGWVPERLYFSNNSLKRIEELGNHVINHMQISLMNTFVVWALKCVARRVCLTSISCGFPVHSGKECSTSCSCGLHSFFLYTGSVIGLRLFYCRIGLL